MQLIFSPSLGRPNFKLVWHVVKEAERRPCDSSQPMNMRAEQPGLSLRVLLFLQLSNFCIFIIHYHLRSISNFALN